jgi:hypothetical protein
MTFLSMGEMAGNPSSLVGSTTIFVVGGSRGEGSTSPITSPMLPIEHTNKDAVRGEEWSDVGSDEEKKGGRMYWSEEDNLRLISSWINNSNDPIDGNSKSGPRYWKQVADEYNMHAPKGKKRTPTQCKNHWNTTSALISKFHGCWVDISNTYASGRSDQQLMEMVHEEYKRVKQTDKPFPFEYWWRVVKDEPKWLNRDVAAVIRNKRNKVLAYGTCTDMFDENLQIAKSTLIETLENFCKGIIECFGPNYLRRPTAEDIHRLLHVGEARGFPGMLGSIDCMH